MSWVDLNTSFAAADFPLHAGLCTDVISGNLAQMYSNSGFDISTTGWATASGAADLEADFTTSWSWLEDFGEHIIPVRTSCSGDDIYRTYEVTLDAETTSGTATVRVCMFPFPYDSPIASEAIFDAGVYAELTAFTTTWSANSGTIAPEGVGRQLPTPRSYPPDTIGHNLPEIPVVYFRVAVKGSGSAKLYVRSFRIKEIP